MKNTVLIMFFACQILFSQVKINEHSPTIYITDYINKNKEDIKIEGNFIVLEFWATWCAPCLDAVPHLNEIQSKYAENKNLIFLSITNENPEKIKKIVAKIPFKSIVVSDQSDKTKKEYLGVNPSIPQTILIDRKGIVKWIGNPKELNSELIDNFLLETYIEKATVEKIDESMPFIPSINPDKLTTQLLSLINNNEVNYFFALTKGNAVDSRGSSNYLKNEGLYAEMNNNLITIFSNLNTVNKTRILLPKKYLNENYNILYKNLIKKEDISHTMKLIKEELIKQLQFKEKKIIKELDVYRIKVTDSSKLEKSLDNFTSFTMDSSHMFFNKSTLIDLSREIEQNLNIYINNNNNIDNKITSDFILRRDSLEHLQEDLKTYGLKLIKIKGKVEFLEYLEN